MKRKEEILQAANNYKNCFPDGFINEFVYIDGAEWADEHPKKGLVDIEKVCNFLSNIDIKKYISSLTDGAGFVNIHIGDIIEDMKKAMEE